MSYMIKETFLTLQGEGFHAGRRAVFVRFTGCNLWNGKEQDREKGKGACARWCDTDFFGGTRWEAKELAGHVRDLWWGAHTSQALVVLTGGEPALQVDAKLLDAFRELGFTVAMETNGSVDLKARPDWVTLSPKLGGTVVLETPVDEMKVVLPGHIDREQGWTEEQLIRMHMGWGYPRAEHYFVQPMDPGAYSQPGRMRDVLWEQNGQACVNFVLRHPIWRVSVQTHKLLHLR